MNSNARVRFHRQGDSLLAISGHREDVARAVSSELSDEYLADVLLRTATEATVAVISFRERLADASRLVSLDVGAIYAHPTQGLQRVAMHMIGGWSRVRTHDEAWRREPVARGRKESER